MSLNWDISKVKDFNELYIKGTWKNDDEFVVDEKGSDKKLNYRTETLIWLTMTIGIGQITEKNYKEFLKRIALYEKLNGNFFRNRPYSLEDIERNIGLRTNVSNEPFGKWIKRIYDNWEA